MEEIKLCASVEAESMDMFLCKLEEVQKTFSCVELRIDSIKNFKISFIHKVRELVYRTAVLSCRKKQDGGIHEINERLRLKIIKEGFKQGYDFIELDVQTAEEAYLMTSGNKRLILSYYDIQQTPSYLELVDIVKRMNALNPYIVKIATRINTSQDEHSVYKLLIKLRSRQKFILVGLGESSKRFNILASFSGNYFTYVQSNSGEVSGFANEKALKEILKEIKIDSSSNGTVNEALSRLRINNQ
ncbi:MAG: type I 3-dehydroquinate dehydratase [Candidatus Dojkabacteria bacterium]